MHTITDDNGVLVLQMDASAVAFSAKLKQVSNSAMQTLSFFLPEATTGIVQVEHIWT